MLVLGCSQGRGGRSSRVEPRRTVVEPVEGGSQGAVGGGVSSFPRRQVISMMRSKLLDHGTWADGFCVVAPILVCVRRCAGPRLTIAFFVGVVVCLCFFVVLPGQGQGAKAKNEILCCEQSRAEFHSWPLRFGSWSCSNFRRCSGI